jgi:hypothetical protein
MITFSIICENMPTVSIVDGFFTVNGEETGIKDGPSTRSWVEEYDETNGSWTIQFYQDRSCNCGSHYPAQVCPVGDCYCG